MMKFKPKRLLAAEALAVAVALAAALPVQADVVLHPGAIQATTGLTGWTSDNTYLSVSGNGAGFSSTSNFTGDSTTMTIEGAQSYDSAYTQQYKYASNGYVYLYQNFNSMGIAVPDGGTATANLRKPGGTIVTQVTVSGGAATASEYTTNSSTSGYSQSLNSGWYTGGDAILPAVADLTTSVTGNVTVAVSDGAGGVLCTTKMSLGTTTATVAEGATAVLNYSVSVGPNDCLIGVKGTVGVNNVPGGLEPNYSYVNTYGYTANWSYLGSFSTSISGNNQPYQFTGLAEGNYYVQAYTYFPNGNYLQLPNQNPAYVPVSQATGMSTRDFIYDGGIITGKVQVTGPYADQVQWGNVTFSGDYDYSQANYGPAAGGYAQGSLDASTGGYSLVMTPGSWKQSNIGLGFKSPSTGITTYNYLYSYNGPTTANVTGGATADVGITTLATSSGVIVFDVIEAPGAPTVGISNPYVYANRYDSATGQSISAQSYAYVQDAASPSVRIVGLPGTYTFDAYATVNGSTTKFATSTITLGEASDTPVGTNVIVTPKDGNGNPSTVTLDFSSITTGGSTTVSVTDVGPAAPSGSTLLQAIDNKEYININSSAQFPSQVEVCISYTLADLGISAAQESGIKLQQYSCDTAGVCSWSVINGTFDGRANPDTTTHTVCGVTSSLSTFALTLSADNCPGVDNPDQLDTDGDGIGDACDADIDNDGVLNAADDCPLFANAQQTDSDGDGIGDACDAINDDPDADGILTAADNCPTAANANQADLDGDNIGDACDADADGDNIDDTSDNCLGLANADQADTDSDSQGNACDSDDDNDGVADAADNCALIANPSQANSDLDAQGDDCDDDDDNDTISDALDNCQFVANANQANTDGDSLGDACDADLDGDGVLNAIDNCLSIANADQSDLDGDGQGDQCDGDVDGDGILNGVDNCAGIANASQSDLDGDQLGDACDSDMDGDGKANSADNCAAVANADQKDTDNDGMGDACDPDDDNDGVADASDNCKFIANANQADFDGDLLGDACDPDDDNDKVLDGADQCPATAPGAVVDKTTGCAIPQMCPCAGPRGQTRAWKNHGEYTSCVEKTAEAYYKKGLISEKVRESVKSAAGQSSCGKSSKKSCDKSTSEKDQDHGEDDKLENCEH